jgi:hypothetical protein
MLQRMSPFMAQSGHHDRAEPCPLLEVKRTSGFQSISSIPKSAHGFAMMPIVVVHLELAVLKLAFRINRSG